MQQRMAVPNVTTYNALISAWENGRQRERAKTSRQASSAANDVAWRDHLQCVDQCLREGHAARAGHVGVRDYAAAGSVA